MPEQTWASRRADTFMRSKWSRPTILQKVPILQRESRKSESRSKQSMLGGLHVCRVFVCVQFPPLQSAPLHNSNGQGPQRSYRTSVARNLVRVGFSTQVRDWGKFCRQPYPVHMEIRPYRKEVFAAVCMLCEFKK